MSDCSNALEKIVNIDNLLVNWTLISNNYINLLCPKIG